MSQPNQQQQQGNQAQSSQSSPPKQMVRIRMKASSGKLLLDRKYKLTDDSIVAKRPKIRDDIVDIIDEFLMPGEEREVPFESVRHLLGGDGKPNRVVDGYQMRKLPGGTMLQDKDGNELPAPLVTEDTWAPGNNGYAVDKATGQPVLMASHPDALIEIVSGPRAA